MIKEAGKNTLDNVPFFTIIIAVTHSLEDLDLCLSSLERLDYPQESYQVVLVDCHVLPGLKEFFEEKLQKYSFRVSPLTLPSQPSKDWPHWLHEARLNEARNYAMKRFPGRHYVFTEDDCMFYPNWLQKFEAALNHEVGALGGPDFLPEGMGWFPMALECILSSFFGTAGAKRGKVPKQEWYYFRKENTAIPAEVFDRVGRFPEKMVFGAEMEMSKRIRDAGLRIEYLPDNPVLHRRVATFGNLLRRNFYISAEKVRLLRQQDAFIKSPHFFVLAAGIAGAFIGLLSLISSLAQSALWVLIGMYIVILAFVGISSIVRKKSVPVGLGVLLLLPFHHLSILCGVIKGVVTKTKPNKTESL